MSYFDYDSKSTAALRRAVKAKPCRGHSKARVQLIRILTGQDPCLPPIQRRGRKRTGPTWQELLEEVSKLGCIGRHGMNKAELQAILDGTKPCRTERKKRKQPEAKRAEAKRAEAKRREAKRAEAKRAEAKRREAKRAEAKRSRLTMIETARKKLNSIHYVHGAYTIKRFESKEYNKTIWLFGEIHSTQFKCPKSAYTSESIPVPVEQYILLQIQASTKPIDFFLETGVLTKTEQKARGLFPGQIRALRELLQACFSYSKTDCPYDHLRAHYIDVRDNMSIMGHSSAADIFYGAPLFNPDLTLSQRREKCKAFLDNKGLTSQQVKDEFARVLEHPRMKKQFNAMKGPTKQSLRNFIEALFSLDFSTFEQDPRTALVDASVTIMDAYALARMFRSFRQVKGKHSEDPSNIIVYAGGFHTARYATFLTLLGFKQTAEAGSPNPRDLCIDIRGLPTLLFGG